MLSEFDCILSKVLPFKLPHSLTIALRWLLNREFLMTTVWDGRMRCLRSELQQWGYAGALNRPPAELLIDLYKFINGMSQN